MKIFKTYRKKMRKKQKMKKASCGRGLAELMLCVKMAILPQVIYKFSPILIKKKHDFS